MPARSDAGKPLVELTGDVGAPESLVVDGAGELAGANTEFVKEAHRMHIKLRATEQGRKSQNHVAEREIGVLSKRWKQRVIKKKVPKRLWGFDLACKSEILSRMARGSNSCTGHEEATRKAADISEWLDFEFYDLAWWLDCPSKPDANDPVHRLASKMAGSVPPRRI